MSDYGSPGPQGSYGQSPQGSPKSSTPAASGSGGDSAQLVMIAGYAAGALGVLSFIWGFLSWFKDGDTGIGGYSVNGAGASAVVGLSLVAGLVAAAAAFEKKAVSAAPAAIALTAFLVSIGILIGKSSIGPDAKFGTGIGLILAVITTIIQAAVLAYAWLLGSGRMSAPAKSPKNQSQNQQWGGPQQGGYGGGYPQAGGSAYPPAGQYGPGQPSAPSYPAPGQYGPPQGSPPPPSPSSPQPPSQGPSGGPPSNPYGPPPGGGYGSPSPSQSGSTSSMPSQGGSYSPPSSPSGSDESDGGYGEATRHIPRYSPPSDPSQGS